MMRGVTRVLQRIAMIPQSFAGFFGKEIRLLVRKKKYLYLSLALPLLIGIIYLFMLNTSADALNVLVCDEDNTPLTQATLDNIDSFSVTISHKEQCEEELKASVKKREYLFGIVIPKGFGQRIEDLQQANITLLYDNSDPAISSLAEWKIDMALQPLRNEIVESFAQELQLTSANAHEKITIGIQAIDTFQISALARARQSVVEADAELIKIKDSDETFFSNPIYVQKRGVHKEQSTLEIGFAPLFAILNMFLLLMLCSTGVMYDRKMKLFSRIRASNSMPGTYILSKLAFFTLLTVMQFVVLYALFTAFGASFTINFGLLIKALLFISLVNTLIGFLIGLISDSEGVAVLISLIFTLPLLFLSGMFYPLELMPKLVQFLANLMPLQSQMLMLKKALLFGGEIIGKFFLMPAGLFILSVFFMKKK